MGRTEYIQFLDPGLPILLLLHTGPWFSGYSMEHHSSDDIIIIGPGEQEVASVLGSFSKIHAYQRMGDKPYKDSRAFYLNEVFKGPNIWDILGTSKVKDKLPHFALTTKKEAVFGGLPWILKTSSTFKCGPVVKPKYHMTWQIQMVLEVSMGR